MVDILELHIKIFYNFFAYRNKSGTFLNEKS
jgi:hypothetical protein